MRKNEGDDGALPKSPKNNSVPYGPRAVTLSFFRGVPGHVLTAALAMLGRDGRFTFPRSPFATDLAGDVAPALAAASAPAPHHDDHLPAAAARQCAGGVSDRQQRLPHPDLDRGNPGSPGPGGGPTRQRRGRPGTSRRTRPHPLDRLARAIPAQRVGLWPPGRRRPSPSPPTTYGERQAS